MVTKTGIQYNFLDALYDLIELEYDALAAYELAVEKLESSIYKTKMTEFKEDHQRHIKELSDLLAEHGSSIPVQGDVKQLLTKGKVVLANLFGDDAILLAMSSNEDDTNTAYKRMCERQDIIEGAKSILMAAWKDEEKHSNWMKQQVCIKA